MPLAIASLFAVASCAPLNGPTALVGVPFSPPVSWNAHWRAMEECSGLSGDPQRIEWYRVADGDLGDQVLGRWDWPHRITLTDFVVSREVAHTIRHEMLHDLLQTGEHPDEFVRCGVL